MTTGVSQRVPAAPASVADSRVFRTGRAVIRTALFTLLGVVVALALGWLVARVPALGIVLGVLSSLLLARTLLMLFIRPNPLVALAHMGVSFALGLGIAFVISMLAG